MNEKRFLGMLLVCAIALNCLYPLARASQVPDEETVHLEDIEWEWVDLSMVEYLQTSAVSRATNSVNCTVSSRSIGIVVQNIGFLAGDTVTFNCSYSPPSTSIDFGVITSDGKFYSIDGKGGSINQTLGINQAGSYSVAIRNNSSQAVSVAGFVDY